MRDSDTITRPLVETSTAILLKYLQGKMSGNDSVKYALAAIKEHIKLLGTEANQDTNRLIAIKMAIDDEKARKEFIKKSLPHLLTDK